MTGPIETGSRPLAHKVVALCRPARRASSWKQVLGAAGAEVVLTPLIAIEDPLHFGPLDRAIEGLVGGAYDWVVFTSITAVEEFLRRMRSLGSGESTQVRARVAAVGKATAESLRACGFEADLVAERQDGLGLLHAFGEARLRGASILLPRAVKGRDEFPEGARALGAGVCVVDAYRTVISEEGAAALREVLASGRLDAVVLTSPSQVRALVGAAGEDSSELSHVLIACIGETTASAAVKAGLLPVTARSPDPEAMLECLISELGQS